jgi:hypothetical protein
MHPKIYKTRAMINAEQETETAKTIRFLRRIAAEIASVPEPWCKELGHEALERAAALSKATGIEQ